MSNLKLKTVEDSITTMTELVMPNDTNPLGNLMGGNLMRWMDVASGICAGRHCDTYAVTASVDHVSFKNAIKLGDVVTISACITRAFTTSVEIYVEVYASDILGTYRHKSNHAYFTFVALDAKTGKPRPVPQLKPQTDEEKSLYEGASRRRELRLILAKRIKPSEATEIKDYFASMS